MTAKASADTAFYNIYNRLVSLNAVGGEPAHYMDFLSTPFTEERCGERRAQWPMHLLTTSTHDANGARTFLSGSMSVGDPGTGELPWPAGRNNSAFESKVRRDCRTRSGTRYLLYQTLLRGLAIWLRWINLSTGVQKRIEQYMIKAIHWAKVHRLDQSS